MVKAMADPVRYRIASAVSELRLDAWSETGDDREPGGVTVRQISERIQEPLRRVRYHVDALCDQGLFEVVAERRRQGVIERYFTITRPFILFEEEMKDLPRAQQEQMLAACVKALLRDVRNSLSSGVAVRRPEWVVAHVFGEVDEQGWSELAARQCEVALEAKDVIAESHKRMKESGDRPFRVVSANLVLEAPLGKASLGEKAEAQRENPITGAN